MIYTYIYIYVVVNLLIFYFRIKLIIKLPNYLTPCTRVELTWGGADSARIVSAPTILLVLDLHPSMPTRDGLADSDARPAVTFTCSPVAPVQNHYQRACERDTDAEEKIAKITLERLTPWLWWHSCEWQVDLFMSINMSRVSNLQTADVSSPIFINHPSSSLSPCPG